MSIDAIKTENGKVAIVIEGKYGDITRAGMTIEQARELAEKLLKLAS